MRTVTALILLLFVVGCSRTKQTNANEQIEQEINAGNFTAAAVLIDSLVDRKGTTAEERYALLTTKDGLHRVRLDFNRTREEVVDWMETNQQFRPGDSLLNLWEETGVLEYRIIDGEKRYFRNAAPNVFRVDASARTLIRAGAPKSDTPLDDLLVDAFHRKVESTTKGKYLLPERTIRFRYTLTVREDQAPEGDTLRVWLPFPRQDIHRQTGVTLSGASQADYLLSGDRTEHTSIYMEQVATKGEATVFWVEFETTSRGEWFDLNEIEAVPYNRESALYKEYTAERAPHGLFSERVRNVTDSITRDAKNPVETLQSIYRYIAANYPWASALEYSTIPNIPEYALEKQKGDCGQVALLMITMLRYKGIPARWQSGWMTHPGDVNLHDWAEVYFEGTGWIPVDISFGRGAAIPIEPGREFFMSGIDSYRLYINSDYSGAFYPEKVFPRSETVDFQRGEVESSRWNLYFDQWRYKMDVSYQ